MLTHVSINDPSLFRMSLYDKSRDQTICETVEALGVGGKYTNQYDVYYPLPYPHLLRAQARLQFKGINGSIVSGLHYSANGVGNVCFRGFTI